MHLICQKCGSRFDADPAFTCKRCTEPDAEIARLRAALEAARAVDRAMLMETYRQAIEECAKVADEQAKKHLKLAAEYEGGPALVEAAHACAAAVAGEICIALRALATQEKKP